MGCLNITVINSRVFELDYYKQSLIQLGLTKY